MKAKILKTCIIVAILALITFLLIRVIDIEDIIMKKVFPRKYSEYVYKYSEEYGIDANLIFAIIKAESNFDSKIVSNSQAKGLMQLVEPTGEEIAQNLSVDYVRDSSLFDEETNIRLGTKYYSELMRQFKGNYILAIIAYNAGIGNVKKWIDDGTLKEDGSNIEDIPFKETKMYVRKIIRNYKVYQEKYK